MTGEQMCECTNPDRDLFAWRGDPGWWSCAQCDGRVRPLTDDEINQRGNRPLQPKED